MLVLTRKAQEKIRIGNEITITILRLKGKTVRVGIEAPSTVPVLRGELAVAIDQEQDAERGDPPAPRPAAQRGASLPGEHGRDWPQDASRHDAQGRVAHTRVPRSRVATVLPTMLGESGPLRAMLDRRSAPN